MFERYTNRARQSVVLAAQEARRLRHGSIGTEHLLLGVIEEGEGSGVEALQGLGVSLDAVRGQVLKIIGNGTVGSADHLPFQPDAKKAFELALEESLLMGHEHIGTEDILLGLIHEGSGVAAQVLVRHGADLDRVRAQVARQPPENLGERSSGDWTS